MAPGGRNNPGAPRSPQGQRQQYKPNQTKKPRNEPELYDRLIRGGADLPDDVDEDQYNEFDGSLPTANHSKTETDLTRSKASLMSEYRSFLRTLGLKVENSDFIEETSRQLMFINQSSKAKKGFGDLLVRTDHVYQTVDEYSSFDPGESSGGVVDQIKESLSGAMGGGQVIGDPAEEGFLPGEGRNNRGGKWR